jgi:GTP-binding protein
MFSDRATLHVEAGRGGDGCVAFRREKYVPRGGPSGGDGGRGGDVVIVAEPGLRDLNALRYHPHVRAESGRPGEGSNRTGASGDHARVRVPIGTQVFGDDGTLACDLAHPGAQVVIARGGRGGAGNSRFATATRRTPRIAGLGEEGETRTLDLHLKLMADAALLGFPNVGKSSLLRRISNATPKVADYPFTTIHPVLGTVDVDADHQLTVVDVPGLLEGASEGIGLGHEFLAHLERARLLLHVVSAELDVEEAREGFAVINGELAAHGHGLADRPQILVLNKIDLVPADDRPALTAAMAAAVGDVEAVVATSCVSQEGIASLIAILALHCPQATVEAPPADELADYLVYRPGSEERDRFRIYRDEYGFRVTGIGVERALAHLDPDSAEDAREAGAILADLGVMRALRRAGARDLTEVTVGAKRFELYAVAP